MTDCVLDASAVMALLRRERGADTVEARLPTSSISAASYAEVISKLIDLGAPAKDAAEVAGQLGMAVLALDEIGARAAGMLRDVTRAYGLSLGDRACLALATSLGLPVLTADRAWASLDLPIEVVLIR